MGEGGREMAYTQHYYIASSREMPKENENKSNYIPCLSQ